LSGQRRTRRLCNYRLCDRAHYSCAVYNGGSRNIGKRLCQACWDVDLLLDYINSVWGGRPLVSFTVSAPDCVRRLSKVQYNSDMGPKRRKNQRRAKVADNVTGTDATASSASVPKGLEELAAEQTTSWKTNCGELLALRDAAWKNVIALIEDARLAGESPHSSSPSDACDTPEVLNTDKHTAELENQVQDMSATNATREETDRVTMTVQQVENYKEQIGQCMDECLTLVGLGRLITSPTETEGRLSPQAQRMETRLKNERIVYDTLAERFLQDAHGKEIVDPNEDRSSRLRAALEELADLRAGADWLRSASNASKLSALLPKENPSIQIQRWPSGRLEAKARLDPTFSGISKEAWKRLEETMLFVSASGKLGNDCKVWDHSIAPREWGVSVLPRDYSLPDAVTSAITKLVEESFEEQTTLREELEERSRRLGMSDLGRRGDAAGIDEAVSLAQSCRVADRWIESLPDAVERFWADYSRARKTGLEALTSSIVELTHVAANTDVKKALNSFASLTEKMTDSRRYATASLADTRRRLCTGSEEEKEKLAREQDDAISQLQATEQTFEAEMRELRSETARLALPKTGMKGSTRHAIVTYLRSADSAQ